MFTKWTFRMLFGLIFVLPGIGLLALTIGHQTALSSVVPLFALAAFWAVLIWGAPWWSARIQFRQQPAAQGARTMMLDGSGIHWRWNGGQADVEWINFIRFFESKTAFLLYTSPACFNIVPKRAFAPGETDSFRGLLQEKMRAAMATHGKKVSPRLIVLLVVTGAALILLLAAIRNALFSTH